MATVTSFTGPHITQLLDNLKTELTSKSVQTVNAGADLAAPRPEGAGIVYWRFNANVNIGTDGSLIVNALVGDQFFVANP